MSAPGPELEETPARQGQTGTGLKWVLRASLVLIVVAFAVLWLAYAHHGAREQAAMAPTGSAASAADHQASGAGG